ncbi:MAG: DNA repair protein RecN [Pseudomonadota bacterium]
MLRDLSIRDILLIDRLDLGFAPGLNVLTGETGAGKSILLDALGFVLGWRGRAELVREGAVEGVVEAVFELGPDHPAHGILDAAGLPGGDELILRRINTQDGRKRAFVNDRRAGSEVLRALSDTLVELHGQHDDKGLLDPKRHRALLDAFGGLDEAVSAQRALWRAQTSAMRAVKTAQDALAEAARDADFLSHAVAELDALDPQPGEEAQLDAERRLMRAAGQIREEVDRAASALGAEGAEGRLHDGLRWLEDAAGRADGVLDAPIAALSRTLAELDEATRGIQAAQDQLRHDPAALERVEERLFAIRALARKHNVAPDAVPDLALDLRARLETLDQGEAGLARLQAEAEAARLAYDTGAQALSTARHASAAKLDAAMAKELAPLKLERAVFASKVTPAAQDPGPEGIDRVVFEVATNPGAPAGPINRIASGGELSRFLLALKVCLSEQSGGVTMIFDEIDRGVGGATADAVGRRLADVAARGQVITVTHSPQVAALGGHHWQVVKSVEDAQTRTDVHALGEAERVDELARMLAGDRVTEEARAAARALLAAR